MQAAPEPVPTPSSLGPIGQFAAKTAIVTAAILVAGWVALDYVDDMVSRRMEQLELALKPVTSLGGRQFWSRLEAELDRRAAPAADIPPEKKRKLLAQIKIIADRWRPFLTEAAAAINGEAKEPGKP